MCLASFYLALEKRQKSQPIQNAITRGKIPHTGHKASIDPEGQCFEKWCTQYFCESRIKVKTNICEHNIFLNPDLR